MKTNSSFQTNVKKHLSEVKDLQKKSKALHQSMAAMDKKIGKAQKLLKSL